MVLVLALIAAGCAPTKSKHLVTWMSDPALYTRICKLEPPAEPQVRSIRVAAFYETDLSHYQILEDPSCDTHNGEILRVGDSPNGDSTVKQLFAVTSKGCEGSPCPVEIQVDVDLKLTVGSDGHLYADLEHVHYSKQVH
jgi:hypothetical protein